MKTKAYLYIITAAICWGLIGLFVRTLAAQGFSSMQIVALRSLAAESASHCRCCGQEVPPCASDCVTSGFSSAPASAAWYSSTTATSTPCSRQAWQWQRYCFTPRLYSLCLCHCCASAKPSRALRRSLCCSPSAAAPASPAFSAAALRLRSAACSMA